MMSTQHSVHAQTLQDYVELDWRQLGLLFVYLLFVRLKGCGLVQDYIYII